MILPDSVRHEQPSGTDVAVLMPMLYGVRNVVYSGVLQGLAREGLRVAVLVRRAPDLTREAFAAFRDAASVEELQSHPVRSLRGSALLNGVLTRAFTRRHGIASHDLYRDWFGRGAGALERVRRAAIGALGTLTSGPMGLQALRRVTEARNRRSVDLEPFRRHLEKLAPRLLWSTSCHSQYELPYILAARDLGIPTAASILSFDNLTSRPALPAFDQYLVWSERMRGEVERLYPEAAPGHVTVTGTPQFDFHLRPEYRWDGERTRRALGLPSGAPFLLYAASHVSLAPEEPAVVRMLADRMNQHNRLSALWLVVRLHPQDDGSRWKDLAGSANRIVVSQACDAAPDADGWKLPTPEEQARMVSSLLHAAACLNIVSTMSLDAALLDRPVVGIDFRGEPAAPRGIMYSEYEATHYRPLVESGGIALGRTWNELLDHLEEAVVDPGWRSVERAAMVRDTCGFVDGASTGRVVAAIRQLVGLPHRTPASLPDSSAQRRPSLSET